MIFPDPMTTKLRVALPADLPAIIEIEQQSPTAAHWQISQYQAILRDSSRLVLLAERDSQLLGFLVASKATQDWELENIAVAPRARHRGIGRALVGALISQAQAAGAREIRQEIRASNLPAQLLGQAAGFAQEGRRRRYYHDPEEDALLFKYLVNRS